MTELSLKKVTAVYGDFYILWEMNHRTQLLGQGTDKIASLLFFLQRPYSLLKKKNKLRNKQTPPTTHHHHHHHHPTPILLSIMQNYIHQLLLMSNFRLVGLMWRPAV